MIAAQHRHRAAPAPSAASDPRCCGLVPEVRRRGDRQHARRSARPRTCSRWSSMNAHHHFARRSSSAWAKYADAFRRISFARFSSTILALQLLQSLRARRSSGRAAGRRRAPPGAPTAAASRPCSRASRRSTAIAAHCDGCSGACSSTIRTARSRTSGEYLLGRPMGSILSRNEPSDKPGTIHDLGIQLSERHSCASACEGRRKLLRIGVNSRGCQSETYGRVHRGNPPVSD